MQMFFDLVKKNSKKNIKENALFFVSLIVSIIAFYIILSLGNQDVIVFLKTMESDAVNKLLILIPVLYAFSLFILFFLVYFAGKYQLERRSHELGMYLMLGMRRSKLFTMLLLEELLNSIISLLIGIPIAIFVSEMISLITAKLVGIGIIGHKFSVSISVILLTCGGYFLIRISSLLIVSKNIAKKEITQLLLQSQDEKHKVFNKLFTTLTLVLGVIFLVVAYTSAIRGNSWASVKNMSMTVTLGICGTFLLFNGLGILFDGILKNLKNKNGLGIFTFRQLQESVFFNPNSLAISSLLVLISFCCFGYGVSITLNNNTKTKNVLHYTFQGEEDEIKFKLDNIQINDYINEIFELKTGRLKTEEYNFSALNLLEDINKKEYSESRDILLNNLQYFTEPYLISLSGYNEILRLSGKEELVLNNNEVALYNGIEFSNLNTVEILKSSLKDNIKVEIGNDEFKLYNGLYQDNIVTDRSINIMYGLIVPDDLFLKYTNSEYSSYFNASLKEDFIKENGLMQSIIKVNGLLSKTNLQYESYLQNMGRQLFYTVAASYTTIYLAVIFLIIANTVIGVQFLMHMQKTRNRYKILISIGAFYTDICKSARNQIKWYFSMPVIIALVGSIFGIRSLFTGISSADMKSQIDTLMISTIPIIIAVCMLEFSYMLAVMRMSDKEIQRLMDIKREDN